MLIASLLLASTACPGFADAAAAKPASSWAALAAEARAGVDVAGMPLPIAVEGDRLLWSDCSVELAPAAPAKLRKTAVYPDDLLSVRTLDPGEVRHVALLAQGTVRARVHAGDDGRVTRVELLESSVGPMTAGRDSFEEAGARGALRLRFAIAALTELRSMRVEPGASVEITRVFLVPSVKLSTLPGSAPRGYR